MNVIDSPSYMQHYLKTLKLAMYGEARGEQTLTLR
jgi:hypothetical protein